MELFKKFTDTIFLKENSNLFKEKNKQDLEKLEYLYKIIPKSHILHRIKIKNKINMYKKLNNAYGMVSVLTILGSLFITIGVIITIIMVSRGM